MTQTATPAHNNAPGPQDDTPWLESDQHRRWLHQQAAAQFAFFAASLNPEGGFYQLDYDGSPRATPMQELHSTTRMIHSYALAQAMGHADADRIIDHGMRYLWSHHRDTDHGGYLWGVGSEGGLDGRKLAYGQVFVLLAAASAKQAGHPDADRLLADVHAVLDAHFWEEEAGLFADEWNRDWTPFSTYRGMNANMHGTEALLASFEATGRPRDLERAGRIIRFFLGTMAPAHGGRVPEHYTAEWQVDPDYAGNPMFRPAGTTPGHSLEWARLWLQYWDLCGRPQDGTPEQVAALLRQTFADAWDTRRGGFYYTLQMDGSPAITDRYWWPVTEGISVLATLLKLAPSPEWEDWYRKLWQFADQRFIDHRHGGWFPEIGPDDLPCVTQFAGKPDIYHSIQATLLPLTPNLSRTMATLPPKL